MLEDLFKEWTILEDWDDFEVEDIVELMSNTGDEDV
jgi:hypothetical protein|tara:strand:- start:271 stop:378 length:108 start_codon:yes stop_codon:yes gene_type:complete